jgi:hypothetical protein
MPLATPLDEGFHCSALRLPNDWAFCAPAAQMVSNPKYWIAFYPEYRNSPAQEIEFIRREGLT